MRIDFVVEGPPVGKQRAIVTKRGAFTPAKTRAYERLVGNEARFALLEAAKEHWPFDAHYSLTCRIYMQDERRRDIDNVGKAVSDALNGVAYDDDSQVHEVHLYRYLSREHPRVEVALEVL